MNIPIKILNLVGATDNPSQKTETLRESITKAPQQSKIETIPDKKSPTQQKQTIQIKQSAQIKHNNSLIKKLKLINKAKGFQKH